MDFPGSEEVPAPAASASPCLPSQCSVPGLDAPPAAFTPSSVPLPSLSAEPWSWKTDCTSTPSEGTSHHSAPGPVAAFISETEEEELIKEELDVWCQAPCVSAKTAAAAALFVDNFDSSATPIEFGDSEVGLDPEPVLCEPSPPPRSASPPRCKPDSVRPTLFVSVLPRMMPAVAGGVGVGVSGLLHLCSVCRKAFRTSAQRDVHLRIHTGERPFSCEECEKAFRSTQSLAAHRLIHKEDRPYRCEQCGRGFRQSSNLASHRLIHTGVRPHKCGLCGKGFIKSSDLRRHSKVHLKADF